MYAQIACLVLGYISTALCAATNFWSLWAISGPESASVLGAIWAWKGLWADCMQIYGGQYYCEEQGSLLMEDAYRITIQALMCLATCLSAFACGLLLVGMECSLMLEGKPESKRKVMFVCAMCFLVAGVFTLISVSWYAAMIVDDFFSFETQDNLIRFELGPTLYLGFVSSFFSLITGFCICCMRGPKAEQYDYRKTSYTPAYTSSKPEKSTDRYGKSGKSSTMEYV